MPKTIIISLAKNTFQISDGDNKFKEFTIYNFDNDIATYKNVDFADPITKQPVAVLVSENADKISKKNVPYVPVMQAVWNNADINLKNFKAFMKSNFSISRIFKHNAVVIMPADSIEVDKRCVKDFLAISWFIRRILLLEIGLVLGSPETCYIAVTKSIRTVAISLIKDGGILKQEIFPLEYNDLAHLKLLVSSWASEFSVSSPPVLLYGNGIEVFSSLGTIVSDDEVLTNLVRIGNFIKKF